MIHTINLSKRLTTVASFLPMGAYFADIGSDHAYLTCYVCLQDQNAKAVAGEVNVGPYNSACETVASYNLLDRIQVRLGDGLEVLGNDQIKQIVIAGMGGSLIRKILDEGRQYLDHVERIIVQPNIGEKNVRKWFLENDFTIINETIIEDNEHIYEILVADKAVEKNPYLAIEKEKQKQLLFGPLLLNEKSPIFLKKWTIQEKKLRKVIEQMKKATVQNKEKVKQLEIELQWIEEAIHGGKNDC